MTQLNLGHKLFNWGTSIGVILFGFVVSGSIAIAQQPQRVRVIIGFHQPPTQAEINAVRKGGGTVTNRFRLISSVAAEVPVAAIAGLAKHPLVKIIEPDIECRADEYGDDWGVVRIGSRLVHEGNVSFDPVTTLVELDYEETWVIHKKNLPSPSVAQHARLKSNGKFQCSVKPGDG